MKREAKISQLIGKRISVYWPTEKRRFIGTVTRYKPKKRKFIVKYVWDNEEYPESLLGKNKVDWRFCYDNEEEDYSDAIDPNIRKYGPKYLREKKDSTEESSSERGM
jgi:hypothetical protein